MSNSEKPRDKFRRLLESEAETRAEPHDEELLTGSRARSNAPSIVDKNKPPLPKRVDEIDVGATRVSQAAYKHPSARKRRNPAVIRRVSPTRSRPSFKWSDAGSCLVQALIISMFIVVALG